MTNDERSPNDPPSPSFGAAGKIQYEFETAPRFSSFVLRYSFGIRHSCFAAYTAMQRREATPCLRGFVINKRSLYLPHVRQNSCKPMSGETLNAPPPLRSVSSTERTLPRHLLYSI